MKRLVTFGRVEKPLGHAEFSVGPFSGVGQVSILEPVKVIVEFDEPGDPPWEERQYAEGQ